MIGLSASLTCFAFIAAWVMDEWNYDRFNKNYDRIYRLTNLEKTETGMSESAETAAPMAAAIRKDYPEVGQTVRLKMREEIVEYQNIKALQSNILLTDPSFFDVFSFHLSRGNLQTALQEPYSLILTASVARQYFGNKDPIGKRLTINLYDNNGYGAEYKVTGVMDDPPVGSHFSFTMLASFKTIETARPNVLTKEGWSNAGYHTYLLLKEGVDPKAFSKKISHFYERYIGADFNSWRNKYSYRLQPLRDIHLRSHLQHEIASTGNIKDVYIFSSIGILILLLAGINYVNLSTARALERAKEVSIKKVVGADRKQLFFQYMLEAVMTTCIAFLFSVVFCILLKPLFLSVAAKNISPFSSAGLWLFMACVTVILGVLCGIYPALIISGFKPMYILKGSLVSGSKAVLLRKSLVTAEFIITLILITSIITIRLQMSFIRHKDLGYRSEGLIFLKVNGNTDVINRYASFRQALTASPLITGVARSNSLIGTGLGSSPSETVDRNGRPLQVSTARLLADSQFFHVYDIRILAGKNFSPVSFADSLRPVILNETAVKTFGWQGPDNALGKNFMSSGQRGIVIAVVKDFHFNSLQETIQPLAIYPLQERFSRISVRINLNQPRQSLEWIAKTWTAYFPSALFDYNFLDKQIGEQYRAEEQFSNIFSVFSILSLLIACLGLYGLVTYAASQQVKEISIRKVLGASSSEIVALLAKDFMVQLLLACSIALPVAWFIMQKWLNDFAYRIQMGWQIFAIAGTLVLLVAFSTICLQAIKAANVSPVKNLRG